MDVDDLALLQMRLARGGALGLAEFSRMGTGAVNDLRLEIYGEQGAIKLSLEDPDWLEVYDARVPDRPLGGARGFTRCRDGAALRWGRLARLDSADGVRPFARRMPVSFPARPLG